MNGALLFVAGALLIAALLITLEVLFGLWRHSTPAASMGFIMSYSEPHSALERLELALRDAGGSLDGNQEAGCFRAPIAGSMVEGVYEIATLDTYTWTIESNPAELSGEVIAAALQEYAAPRPSPDLVTE